MQKKILKLRAQVKYDPEVAKRAMDMRYYRAQDINMKKFAFIESEKLRLSTGKWKTITDIIMKYRLEGMNTISTTGKILNGIDEKNKMMAQGKSRFKKQLTSFQSFVKQKRFYSPTSESNEIRGPLQEHLT